MFRLVIAFLVAEINNIHGGLIEPDWNQLGKIADILKIPSNIFGNRGRSVNLKAEKWPKGVVPYIIDKGISKLRRDNIETAIRQFNLHTCVKFVPRKKEDHYLQFFSKDGCSSFVGVQRYFSSAQPLNLAPGCRVSDTMHEMMHALGFEHEHQRFDRDDYVKVHLDLIPKEYHWIFVKLENDPEVAKLSYDYLSLMHYTTTAFNNNTDKTTIEPLLKDAYPNLSERIGMESGFSTCDILKINTAYKCPGYEKASTDVCKMGQVVRIPIKSCAADSQAFCKNLVGKNDDKCHYEPGKYLINCRNSCDNCEGACYNSLDYDKNLACDDLAAKMEQGVVKSCNAQQKDMCPMTCGLC
uniref:Metalloendopeptidase n=1 Tax=Romanomermis culicivorax TaxID=13658 RepID=A0A915KWE0_ROMCU